MKNILFLNLLLLFMACQPKELPTILTQSEGYALMKVSHMTTKNELTEMTQKLSMQSIKIDFSSSEFFGNGSLRSLKLTVETPESNRGTTSADLVTLQFNYYGFIYQKEGNPVFKIGNI